MTIKIKDIEYKIRYTIKACVLFEQISGKAFEIATMLDHILFFYCVLLANNKDTFNMDFETFMDEVDADSDLLPRFAKMLQVENQTESLMEAKETAEEDKKKD